MFELKQTEPSRWQSRTKVRKIINETSQEIVFRKVVTRSVFTWARSTSAAQQDVWPDSRFEDYLKFSLSCKHTCARTPMQQSKPQPVKVSMIPPHSQASFFSPIRNPCSVESACLLNVLWWLPGWACWGPICCNLPGPLLPQMWWLRALWVWNSWWDKEREREQGTSLLLLSSHSVWERAMLCANGTNYAPESTADGLILQQKR